MEATVQLKRTRDEEAYYPQYCIICQKKNKDGLVSTENGRTCITVDEELYLSEQVLYNRECKEFVVDCAQNICLDPSSLMLPSWAGIQALLSQSEVPAMQVGFLPFIPNPVTEHATVYTAMLNFLKIAKQLKQGALPIFLR